jgi:hypothetical protein
MGRSRRVFATSTRDRPAGGVVASSSLTARGPVESTDGVSREERGVIVVTVA